MKNYIILIITTILLFSCSTDKKEAIEHYTKAKEFYKNGDIKNASSEIELAINLDSSNLDFQIIKAKILTKTNNYELAIEILKEVTDKKFKLDTVNYNIGSCYFSYGLFFDMTQNNREKVNESYGEALNYYNNAININTQYFDAYNGKLRTLHNLERHDEALVVLNTAINLFPDSSSLICYRGIEKLFLGDLSGAMVDLNKSIQSNKLDSSGFARAYRYRGILFSRKEKYDEAINDYTKSLKYNSKNSYTLFNRADSYREKGLKEKACEDYRKAADLGYISLYKTIKEYCDE